MMLSLHGAENMVSNPEVVDASRLDLDLDCIKYSCQAVNVTKCALGWTLQLRIASALWPATSACAIEMATSTQWGPKSRPGLLDP